MKLLTWEIGMIVLLCRSPVSSASVETVLPCMLEASDRFSLWTRRRFIWWHFHLLWRGDAHSRTEGDRCVMTSCCPLCFSSELSWSSRFLSIDSQLGLDGVIILRWNLFWIDSDVCRYVVLFFHTMNPFTLWRFLLSDLLVCLGKPFTNLTHHIKASSSQPYFIVNSTSYRYHQAFANISLAQHSCWCSIQNWYRLFVDIWRVSFIDVVYNFIRKLTILLLDRL